MKDITIDRKKQTITLAGKLADCLINSFNGEYKNLTKERLATDLLAEIEREYRK
jgi:hypothetical protein